MAYEVPTEWIFRQVHYVSCIQSKMNPGQVGSSHLGWVILVGLTRPGRQHRLVGTMYLYGYTVKRYVSRYVHG